MFVVFDAVGRKKTSYIVNKGFRCSAVVCCVVPDASTALAVGPIKPIVGQARSESASVCIMCV